MNGEVERVSTVAGATASILVAEDSAIQAELLRRLLSRTGHRVTVARDGEEALERLRAEPFDLLLSDVKMPRLGGIELCRAIRREGVAGNPRIVLVTTLDNIDDIAAGLNAGADNYILKPYEDAQLLSMVGAELDDNREVDGDGDGVPVHINVRVEGRRYDIEAPPRRIAKLLISTYETAERQNRQLVDAEMDMKAANRRLEAQIQALRAADHQLRESDERFRAIADICPDIIYRISPDGRLTYLNDAVRMYGFDPAELLGQHFSALFAREDVERASRDRVLPGCAGVATGNEAAPKLIDERRCASRATRGLEVALPGAGEGERCIGEINSSGLYNGEDGREFNGTVGIVRDITLRKRAEERVQQINEELAGRVDERTRELYVANRNLEKTLDELNASQMQIIQSEKLASLGTLVAGVAHELNNPLMAVLNYVQHVRRHLEQEGLDDYLAKAERHIQRAARIVANMLTFSRRESLMMESVDVRRVVEDALELLAAELRHSGIEVDNRLPRGLPPVRAVDASLQQVLLNLFTNARDAMLAVAERRLWIESDLREDVLEIQVRDSGPGMPAEVLRRIFDPFFTTKPDGKGTGLGLSVSANLVRGFGGELICESREGEGALFRIRLHIDVDPPEEDLSVVSNPI